MQFKTQNTESKAFKVDVPEAWWSSFRYWVDPLLEVGLDPGLEEPCPAPRYWLLRGPVPMPARLSPALDGVERSLMDWRLSLRCMPSRGVKMIIK